MDVLFKNSLNATSAGPYSGVLDEWHLISTPWPMIATISAYLLFVLKLGPEYMKDKKPYDLKYLMIAYNLFQVVYNGSLVVWLVTHGEAIPYLWNHTCHPLDPTKNPLRAGLHLASWYYLVSKYIDLSDTIFMVLRRKQTHVTFLHLYHHTGMIFFSWLSMKYIQAEQGIFLGSMNAFVHVVMYTYYFLAGLGPEIQKYLWWKRYITKVQLAQFFIAIIFLGYLFYNKCEVSQAYNVIWMINVAVFIVLFMNFYIKTYWKSPTTQSAPDGRKTKKS